MAGPGDEMAAGTTGRGRLRASHGDRELVIDTLKAAFVQGRLSKDELDMRVGQVLASRTCADLAAVTADIPAGMAAAQPAPDRARARKPMTEGVKAVAWSAGIPLAGLLVAVATATGNGALFLLSSVLLYRGGGGRVGRDSRGVGAEALPRTAAAGAASWRGRSGIPAPSTCRPG